MQAKAVCFFCLRKAWQIFAITLVTLAVLVSALKYALPYANDYRSNIEALIQKQLNVDISIGQSVRVGKAMGLLWCWNRSLLKTIKTRQSPLILPKPLCSSMYLSLYDKCRSHLTILYWKGLRPI